MIKNLKLFIMLFCIMSIISCEENTHSSFISDNGLIPDEVVLVDNPVRDFAGGAEITYNITDENVLYVVGEFDRSGNGDLASVKSSVFNNSIILEGFAKADVFDIDLYTVSPSGKKSVGVPVVINPEKPGYQFVCESIYAEPTYGGLNVFWTNPVGSIVYVELYTVDETGNLIFQSQISSSKTSESAQILGLAPVETDFVFVVSDAYNNKCDEIRITETPLYVEIFNRDTFRGIVQPFDQLSAYEDWPLSKLYDGITGKSNGFHTIAKGGLADPDPVLPYYQGYEIEGAPWRVPLFTIDIGYITQLYRFRYWPRVDYEWRHGNPREFDLWGSPTLNVDGSLDGWTLLLDKALVIKPSGTENCSDCDTEEDIAFATAGISFDIDPNLPKIRYIRYAQRLAQNFKSTLLHISEIELSGDNRGIVDAEVESE